MNDRDQLENSKNTTAKRLKQVGVFLFGCAICGEIGCLIDYSMGESSDKLKLSALIIGIAGGVGVLLFFHDFIFVRQSNKSKDSAVHESSLKGLSKNVCKFDELKYYAAISSPRDSLENMNDEHKDQEKNKEQPSNDSKEIINRIDELLTIFSFMNDKSEKISTVQAENKSDAPIIEVRQKNHTNKIDSLKNEITDELLAIVNNTRYKNIQKYRRLKSRWLNFINNRWINRQRDHADELTSIKNI